MKTFQHANRQVKSAGLALIISAALVFSSCNQKGGTNTTAATTTDSTTVPNKTKVHPFITSTLTTIVKESWNPGPPTTHANDSVMYSSGSNSYKVYTASNGTASLTDTNYTAGNPVIMEACANDEICGKVFNQALTKLSDDNNLVSPTFTITALATGDSIPLRILVTDMSGNPYVGYSVQITSGGTNYGTATTTNSSGITTYSRQLAQGQSYSVTATGSAGKASATVSTSPLTGSSGNFSGIGVYIRF